MDKIIIDINVQYYFLVYLYTKIILFMRNEVVDRAGLTATQTGASWIADRLFKGMIITDLYQLTRDFLLSHIIYRKKNYHATFYSSAVFGAGRGKYFGFYLRFCLLQKG